jgi:integrase
MSVYDRSQENKRREQLKITSSNGRKAVLSQEEENGSQKRKRKVARWYYDFTIEGRRYKGPIPGARNRKEAEKVELQKRLEVYEDRYGKELGTEDFAKFVNEIYLPASKTNKRSWRHDEFRARTLCEYFAGMSFREINQMRIEKFKQDRLKTKSQRGTTFSPASVNHELALLSSIFTMARKNRLIRENPCIDVEKLEVDNERERYLTIKEEARLFAQLTGRRSHLRAIVTIALHTGIRRGALLALRWQDVDFTRNVITITKGKSKNKKMYVVPMNETVRAELAALRPWSNDRDDVFTNAITGVSVKDIKKGFVSACEDAEIEDFRFHDLRHTFATRLADQGVPQSAIRDMLGQTSLRMSQRYTHAVIETMQAAVEKLCQGNSTLCPIFPPQSADQTNQSVAA